MLKFAALVSASFLLGGSSLPDDPDLQSLTFRTGFAYAICAGLCPTYDLTLTPNGLVEVQQRDLKEHYRFRVTRSAARAAIASVSEFRSAARGSSRGPCAVPTGSDAELFDPNVVQFAIEWQGRRGAERLAFCAEDGDAVAAFHSAISMLGVDLAGRPLVKQREDGTRYGRRVSCDLGGGRWSPPRYDCHFCPPDSIKSSAKFYAVDLTNCRVILPRQ
jgi:hypothetical protein